MRLQCGVYPQTFVFSTLITCVPSIQENTGARLKHEWSGMVWQPEAICAGPFTVSFALHERRGTW